MTLRCRPSTSIPSSKWNPWRQKTKIAEAKVTGIGQTASQNNGSSLNAALTTPKIAVTQLLHRYASAVSDGRRAPPEIGRIEDSAIKHEQISVCSQLSQVFQALRVDVAGKSYTFVFIFDAIGDSRSVAMMRRDAKDFNSTWR
jgi:hypothetical protein